MTTTCTACAKPIQLAERHVTYARQLEVEDPPGHVVEVGYSEVHATYHLDCSPEKWWTT